MVAEIVVRHRTGGYPVRIGAGLADGLEATLAAVAPGGRPTIITDSNVNAAWPSLLASTTRLVFPAGEAHKSRDSWITLTDQLLDAGTDRDTVVVALGGGVTSDVAGFVAATTLRGLRWIAVPTTTLAMLDAAVGGKTGVDTRHGKNLVGAFHPPVAVLADPRLLASLDAGTFRDGLAEAIKHAAIASDAHWQWLGANHAAILDRDPEAVTEMVRASVAIKARIVAGDEREAGERAILNAGHTIAHAIEHASDFTVSHGRAVAIGLVLETRLAERLGVAEPGTAERVGALLQLFGLPITPPAGLDATRVREALRLDKKNRDGRVHAALLGEIGRVARTETGAWTRAVDADELLALLTPRP